MSKRQKNVLLGEVSSFLYDVKKKTIRNLSYFSFSFLLIEKGRLPQKELESTFFREVAGSFFSLIGSRFLPIIFGKSREWIYLLCCC